MAPNLSWKGVGDAEEFLEDIELHFESSQYDKLDMSTKHKMFLSCLRTSIEPDLKGSWWDKLPVSVRKDWQASKEAFAARFPPRTTTDVFRSYNLISRIAVFKQGSLSLKQYIAEAKRLDEDIGAEPDDAKNKSILVFRFVSGLADKQIRTLTTFGLKEKISTCTLQEAINECEWTMDLQAEAASSSPIESPTRSQKAQGQGLDPIVEALIKSLATGIQGNGWGEQTKESTELRQRLLNALMHTSGSDRPSTAPALPSAAPAAFVGRAQAPPAYPYQTMGQKPGNATFAPPSSATIQPYQQQFNSATRSSGYPPFAGFTCFNCGESGHQSRECGNAPLPSWEQLAIKLKVMKEKAEREERLRPSATAPQLPLGGAPIAANMVSIEDRDKAMEDRNMVAAYLDPAQRAATIAMMVATNSSLPNGPTEVNAVTIENGEDPTVKVLRDMEALRLQGGKEDWWTARSDRRMDLNQVKAVDVMAIDSVRMEEILQNQRLILEAYAATKRKAEEAQEMEQEDSDELPTARQRRDDPEESAAKNPSGEKPVKKLSETGKPRTDRIKYPIKALTGPAFSMKKFLNETNVTMTLAQAWDMSPQLRSETVGSMRSTKPVVPRPPRKSQSVETNLIDIAPKVISPEEVYKVGIQTGTMVAHDGTTKDYFAISDDGTEVKSFIIPATVWDDRGAKLATHSISKLLVDGGSLVSLIAEKTAKEFKLEIVPSKDLTIRLADKRTKQIEGYVKVCIQVGGVIAKVICWVLPIQTSYEILLGKRWLKQVRAVQDWDRDCLVIMDANGEEFEVAAAEKTSTRPPVIVRSEEEDEEFDDELWELHENECDSADDLVDAYVEDVLESMDPSSVEAYMNEDERQYYRQYYKGLGKASAQ